MPDPTVVGAAEMGWWDWAGIGFGIAGMAFGIMILPALAQIIWGRPRLKVFWLYEGDDNNKALRVSIHNEPPRAYPLRLMNVQRPPVYLTAWILVENLDTGATKSRDSYLADNDPVTVLYPHVVAKGHTVVVASKVGGSLGVYAGAGMKSLEPGTYKASIVMAHGPDIEPMSRQFVVGTDLRFIHWL